MNTDGNAEIYLLQDIVEDIEEDIPEEDIDEEENSETGSNPRGFKPPAPQPQISHQSPRHVTSKHCRFLGIQFVFHTFIGNSNRKLQHFFALRDRLSFLY